MKKIIRVEHVSKGFRLPHERSTGLKQAVINFRPGKRYEEQHVLRDVSFDIYEGEFFAILGRNGSGKSTLLKLLAQIYTPDAGNIAINGSLTPFIELGVGFNPELTGRENVYLNGALLGLDRRQVNEIYDEIVDFAELERFMDQRLKNYSSGMQVRLAFSIAIRAKSDILLIDEVLAVGDAAFQQKCFNYFDRLKREKRTMVLVSHDMSAIKQFCDRGVLIDQGEVKLVGDVSDITRAYERLNYNGSDTTPAEAPTPSDSGFTLSALGMDGKPTTKYEYGQDITFELRWPKETDVGIVGVIIARGSEIVFATNSIGQDGAIKDGHARLTVKGALGNGRYRISGGLFGESRHQLLGMVDGPEILIYDQPDKGDNGEEWEGLHYLKSTWGA